MDANRQMGKKLRCTIIGAGVSGILMAYKLQKHLVEYVDFHIYEKSPELGGTWYENRYPGCACDVPSHVYQYSFAPNPEWSQYYASSSEIQNYLKQVVRHFNLDQFISYNSRVIHASWDNSRALWTAEIENHDIVESELLINAGGILNNPQMPDIKGLSSFKGPLLHTAKWDSSVSLEGKQVAIIGAGASAIQLLPKIQPICSQVDVYIRTPSWITPPVALQNAKNKNPRYTEGDMARFRNDRELYLETRKGMENQFNDKFRAFFKAAPEQRDMRSHCEKRMKELIPDPYLQSMLIPSFEVGCRRINPGEEYLVALQKPNVRPVFDRIEKILPDSVVVRKERNDLERRPADVLITATGFNTTFRPRFPILGLDGVNLQDVWASEPTAYMGIAVAGFPNYLMFLGPNTPISNGSLMGPLEATSDYFVRLIRKIVRERVRSFTIQPEAQEAFDKHAQECMKDMVWTGSCRSWFKPNPNGKVTALYPGSSLHYMQILSENRWEDYIWEYRGRTRFDYWGPGISWVEEPGIDPLGLKEREDMVKMTSIPRNGGDFSFYLWESAPLPAHDGGSGSSGRWGWGGVMLPALKEMFIQT